MSTDNVEAIRESVKKAAAVLRQAEVPHALAGGLAVWARGGPEVAHDVDFVILPEDKERALEAMDAAGMRVERPPEDWLYKAYDGDVLVDLIFRASCGATQGYIENAEVLQVESVRMPVMSISDVLIMKLAAMNENYMDYQSVLRIARTTREQIDWEYVRRETKGSPFADAFFALCEGLEIVERSA